MQALKNLLEGSKADPKNDEILSLAIEVVAAAKNNTIDEEFIKLLLGEVDGHARVCIYFKIVLYRYAFSGFFH